MVAVLAVALVVGVQRPAVQSHPFFKEPVLDGAHRGGLHQWPENTTVAFKECSAKYPGMILETDATMTRDGVVVLLHDETVDRTTDGKGDVTKMTFQEVRALDGAYGFSRDKGKTFPYRGKGVKIATLAEALRIAPKARFMIDIKKGGETAAAVIKVIREEKAADRVLLASFIPSAMAKVREIAPEMPRCFSMDSGMKLLNTLRTDGWKSYKPEDDVLSVMKEHVVQFKVTDEEIRSIRAKGILVQIHTLNSKDEIDHWKKVGVDGILTDDPALLGKG